MTVCREQGKKLQTTENVAVNENVIPPNSVLGKAISAAPHQAASLLQTDSSGGREHA